MNPQLSKLVFIVALVLAHLFSTAAVVLVLVWFLHYGSGFGWRSQPNKEFSFHPFFMILGLIFFYTQAALVYRTFPSQPKINLKIVHIAFQVIAALLSITALVAVFDSHNFANPPMPNMYSLHSWVGMGTVVLFVIQLVCGLIFFFPGVPGIPQRIKAFYMPIHQYFGSAIFVMAVATSLMGILEYARFSGTYSQFTEQGILANCLGLCLVLLAICVIYLLVNPTYKRQPRPEDEHFEKLCCR